MVSKDSRKSARASAPASATASATASAGTSAWPSVAALASESAGTDSDTGSLTAEEEALLLRAVPAKAHIGKDAEPKKPLPGSAEASPLAAQCDEVIFIGRNKHYPYIASYHGAWLSLPVEVLSSLFNLNLTPPANRPGPLDHVVFRNLVTVRRLMDDATDLVVKASGPNNQSYGFHGGHGSGHTSAHINALRQHRALEQAVAKMARSYMIDEVATCVVAMQCTSALDDVAYKVLKKNPTNMHAMYVLYFHERIPSRQLASSMDTSRLDQVIEKFPACAEYYRTRAMANCFKEDFVASLRDFKTAIALVKQRKKTQKRMTVKVAADGQFVADDSELTKGQLEQLRQQQRMQLNRQPLHVQQQHMLLRQMLITRQNPLLLAATEQRKNRGPTPFEESEEGSEAQLYFLRGACYHQYAVRLLDDIVFNFVETRAATEQQQRRQQSANAAAAAAATTAAAAAAASPSTTATKKYRKKRKAKAAAAAAAAATAAAAAAAASRQGDQDSDTEADVATSSNKAPANPAGRSKHTASALAATAAEPITSSASAVAPGMLNAMPAPEAGKPVAASATTPPIRSQSTAAIQSLQPAQQQPQAHPQQPSNPYARRRHPYEAGPGEATRSSPTFGSVRKICTDLQPLADAFEPISRQARILARKSIRDYAQFLSYFQQGSWEPFDFNAKPGSPQPPLTAPPAAAAGANSNLKPSCTPPFLVATPTTLPEFLEAMLKDESLFYTSYGDSYEESLKSNKNGESSSSDPTDSDSIADSQSKPPKSVNVGVRRGETAAGMTGAQAKAILPAATATELDATTPVSSTLSIQVGEDASSVDDDEDDVRDKQSDESSSETEPCTKVQLSASPAAAATTSKSRTLTLSTLANSSSSAVSKTINMRSSKATTSGSSNDRGDGSSASNSTSPLTPGPKAKVTYGTYHPLILEAWFGICLNYIILGDWDTLHKWHVRIHEMYRRIDGYPIFLPARSMSQADYIETLRLCCRAVREHRRKEQQHKAAQQGLLVLSGSGKPHRGAAGPDGMGGDYDAGSPPPSFSASSAPRGPGTEDRSANYPMHTRRADVTAIYLETILGLNRPECPDPYAPAAEDCTAEPSGTCSPSRLPAGPDSLMTDLD
ncbi:hypothetical protein BC831DRAFT_553607 [Entophlyctis helioformis]|nr:hypothetical protein BC831DRAFT_553607 [Entophlyctis helioformis]